MRVYLIPVYAWTHPKYGNTAQVAVCNRKQGFGPKHLHLEGTLGFFGGGVEERETPMGALWRELREELPRFFGKPPGSCIETGVRRWGGNGLRCGRGCLDAGGVSAVGGFLYRGCGGRGVQPTRSRLGSTSAAPGCNEPARVLCPGRLGRSPVGWLGPPEGVFSG